MKRIKILWDFEIQMDHLISAWRPDLVIVNKKKKSCRIVKFAISANPWVKFKLSEKKSKYLDFARELKTMEQNCDGDTNYNWCSWYSPQRIGKGIGSRGNKRTNEDHPK